LTHAAESLHWYGRDGRPQYTVKAKDGSDRPATLRDARKLNLVPSRDGHHQVRRGSGASILDAEAGNARGPHASEGRRRDRGRLPLSRILNDSKEQARKAAERGTAIHAAIQGFYQDETTTPGYEAHIQGAVHAVQQWAGEGTEGQWIAEAAFAHQMGFGGKVDLHVPGDVVVDFKTKEFDTTADLKA
jgi:hypothetical protein